MFEPLSDIPKKLYNFYFEEEEMRPTGDKILMEMTKEETVTPGGIIIPYSAQLKQWQGKIIAKGAGKYCDQLEVGKTYILEPMFKRKDGLGTDAIDMPEGQMIVEADLAVAEVEE